MNKLIKPLLFCIGICFGQACYGHLIQVTSISALEAVNVSGLVTGQQAGVSGYYVAADGGGGLFVYDSSSSATSDGGITIAPSSGPGRWARIFGSIVDLQWYGGAANAIQAALAALPNGGTILLNPAGNTVNYAVTIPSNGYSYTIQGTGPSKCFVTRSSSYAAGDIFVITSGTAAATFKDFCIQNAEGFDNTSGYAFDLSNSNFGTILVSNVLIYNGYGGVTVNACGAVHLDHVVFVQSAAQISAGYSAHAGVYITGGSSGTIISNSTFVTQAVGPANALAYGILIDSCNGLQVSNTGINGIYGVFFNPGAGQPLNDSYFDNCIIDGCFTTAVAAVGSTTGVYQNIRFSNCHIVGYNVSGQQDGILVDGPNVFQIVGCNVSGWAGNGITIGAGENITISGNSINDTGAAGAGNFGVLINGTSSQVSVSGGVIGAVAQSPVKMEAGVVVAGSADNVSISGVTFGSFASGGGPVGVNNTPSHLVVLGNSPLDSDIQSVGSAATITLSSYETTKVTGTTAISTITGGWSGRTTRMICTSGLTFNAGGNIATPLTASANQVVLGTFDGTNWYLK